MQNDATVMHNDATIMQNDIEMIHNDSKKEWMMPLLKFREEIETYDNLTVSGSNF